MKVNIRMNNKGISTYYIAFNHSSLYMHINYIYRYIIKCYSGDTV